MGRNRRSAEYKNNSRVIDMEEARRQRLEKRRAEQAKKEEKEIRAQRRNTRGKRAIRRNRARRRLTLAIVIVALALVLFLFVMNIVSLKREQHDVMQQQQQLEKQKEELQKALEDTDDTENIEEQARNQLRLIKPGETLYLFPEEMTEENNSNSLESEDQQ